MPVSMAELPSNPDDYSVQDVLISVIAEGVAAADVGQRSAVRPKILADVMRQVCGNPGTRFTPYPGHGANGMHG